MLGQRNKNFPLPEMSNVRVTGHSYETPDHFLWRFNVYAEETKSKHFRGVFFSLKDVHV